MTSLLCIYSEHLMFGTLPLLAACNCRLNHQKSHSVIRGGAVVTVTIQCRHEVLNSRLVVGMFVNQMIQFRLAVLLP